MRPRRVQLSRKKGWRMPPNTVKIDRSTRWGNPFRIEPGRDAQQAQAQYREWLAKNPEGKALAQAAREELHGKNLACWCKPDAPCHGDVLLQVSNSG